MGQSFARRLIRNRFALAAAAVLTMAAAATPSRALETRDLAGWWIAVDGVFPALWERGTIVTMEELLIVSADGRVENRGLGFWAAATDCVPNEACTDAPLIATARLTLSGDALTVTERTETQQRLNNPQGDPIIRRLAATATPAWTVWNSGNLLVLRSATGNVTRTFARIEPNRLRQLRAGLMVAELSAAGHWRCLLANATASDKAFALLRTDASAAPGFLDAYLRIASYRATLAALGAQPLADSSDPKQRQLASQTIESLMIEPFADLAPPGNAADAERLLATGQWLDAVARGLSADAAAAEVASRTPGKPLDVAVQDTEVAALARVRKGAAKDSSDPEVKKLFCLP